MRSRTVRPRTGYITEKSQSTTTTARQRQETENRSPAVTDLGSKIGGEGVVTAR